MFVGYSSHSKAYKVYNKRTICVEESIHVLFDEIDSTSKSLLDDDDDLTVNIKDLRTLKVEKVIEDWSLAKLFEEDQSSHESDHNEDPALRNWKYKSSHPLNQVIGGLNQGVQTRAKASSSNQHINVCAFSVFLSLTTS